MERPAQRRDATALAAAGAAFMLLACFFLWRDLIVMREALAVVAVAVAGGAAALRRPRSLPAVGPAALLLATVAASAWYLAERTPGVLPALGAAAVVAAVAVALGDRDESAGQPLAERLRWYALGTALLAASWGLYFHFFTIGFAADTVARRLVPTLAWLTLGLSFLVAGRRRGAAPAAAEVGLGFVGIAVAKAAFYDTTHLHGPLRVVVLAAVGALLLFGSQIMRRTSSGAPER
jgi:hypothetical protein